jgi:acetamidase/formamidase
MARHELDDRPEHLHFGYFDAALPPVLRVESGDTVKMACLPAGPAARLPPDGSLVLPSHRTALERVPHALGAHMLTGPVHVDGAERGDVLQIDILEITPRQDWGFVSIGPLVGTLPGEFERSEIIHPLIHRERGVCVLPWGTELPLDPFMGILAVAPPASWGRITSNVPWAFGGNMDNKELRAGATLYLPVFEVGALFSAGDGHGLQGDGEVCITALETALEGVFRLTVRKDLGYETPFAESALHLISIGIDEDLDDAARQAVREMIREICRRSELTRSQAYMLCSLVGDLHVTQTVDGNKGIHMMLPKSALPVDRQER